MYVATSAEMRELDRYAVETIGIPVASLMENAGWETARTAEAFLQKKLRSRTVSGDRAFSWIILVGKGHNGGDGLVAARRLAEAGHRVRIVLAEPPDRMEPETVRQWEIAWRLGIRTDLYSPGANHLSDCDALLDALLGTGVRGAPREPYASLIREANASGRPIVAVDVPSGLDADTGRPYDPCIRAELTVTFALPKSGLVQDPALAFVGRVVVRPIGIDPRWAEAIGVRAMLLGPDAWRRLDIDAERPLRPDTHKGAQGHVLIVGGSRGMAGAGLLCARAALRAGCGLVTWAIPDRLVESMAGRAPEIMLAGVADGGRGDWSAVRPDDVVTLAASRDAVAVGPGLGRFPGGERLIRALWENTDKPLVIDADALNLIASVGDFADWPRRSRRSDAPPGRDGAPLRRHRRRRLDRPDRLRTAFRRKTRRRRRAEGRPHRRRRSGRFRVHQHDGQSRHGHSRQRGRPHRRRRRPARPRIHALAGRGARGISARQGR